MKCDVCGTDLPAYAGKGRPKTTCSARCHRWKASHKGEPPSWLRARICARCGSALPDDDPRRKYCSAHCRRLEAAGSDVGMGRTCSHCGAAFSVGNGKQRYCSPACRIKANRVSDASRLRRAAKGLGSPLGDRRFSLLDVGERDGWVCGLCLGPVDPNIRGDRWLQATVDHITPLSRGGEHALSNVQLAHWSCNAAKRNSDDVATMSVPTREHGRRVIARWQEEDRPPSRTTGA